MKATRVHIDPLTSNDESYLTLEAESPRGYAFYKLESTATKEAINAWAAARFERSCSCSHDCCGHWFTSSIDIFDMYLAPDSSNASDYIIRVTMAQNY